MVPLTHMKFMEMFGGQKKSIVKESKPEFVANADPKHYWFDKYDVNLSWDYRNEPKPEVSPELQVRALRWYETYLPQRTIEEARPFFESDVNEVVCPMLEEFRQRKGSVVTPELIEKMLERHGELTSHHEIGDWLYSLAWFEEHRDKALKSGKLSLEEAEKLNALLGEVSLGILFETLKKDHKWTLEESKPDGKEIDDPDPWGGRRWRHNRTGTEGLVPVNELNEQEKMEERRKWEESEARLGVEVQKT